MGTDVCTYSLKLMGNISDNQEHIKLILILFIDLGAIEIHIFTIYNTRPCAAILDIHFVQKVLKKVIVLSFTHPLANKMI